MDTMYFKHKTLLLANVDILFQKSSGAENSQKIKLCFNAVFYNGAFTFPIQASESEWIEASEDENEDDDEDGEDSEDESNSDDVSGENEDDGSDEDDASEVTLLSSFGISMLLSHLHNLTSYPIFSKRKCNCFLRIRDAPFFVVTSVKVKSIQSANQICVWSNHSELLNTLN